MEVADIISFIKEAGVSGLFIGAAVFLLMKSGKWIGEKIILPAVYKHFEVLDGLISKLTSTGSDVATVKDHISKIHEISVADTKKISEIHTTIVKN